MLPLVQPQVAPAGVGAGCCCVFDGAPIVSLHLGDALLLAALVAAWMAGVAGTGRDCDCDCAFLELELDEDEDEDGAIAGPPAWSDEKEKDEGGILCAGPR